jgi:peptide/nickel transport system permease protein
MIGIAMGSISGYYRKLDDLIMRFTDIVLTFPSFFLLIVAASVLQVRNLYAIAVTIGFIGWPQMARIVRGEFLSIRELSYVEAARAIGASSSRLIVLHMLPNCMAPIIVTVTLNVARYILYEAAISFLGLGDPTAISWGTIIGRGQQVLRSAWWLTLFPGVMIFLIVLGFNLFGDGFRDVMDPQLAYLHRQEGGN